ncbi:MAG: RNA polymerase factor sigma-54 [Parvularcula sp.]
MGDWEGGVHVSQKLDLRQGQQLVMTPQLQQAIKLLQLTNLELLEFVESQLEENPFLERDERASAQERGEAERGEDRADADAVASVETLDTDYTNVDAEATLADRQAADAGAGDWSSVRAGPGPASEDYDAVSNAAQEKSLHDVLEEQLQLATADPTALMLGAHLIDLIDDAGYLRESTDAIAARLGVDDEDIEDVLSIIQTFDPAGVGARSLAECLRLQLAEQGGLDERIELFLKNLECLSGHNFSALKRATGMKDDEIRQHIEQIRKLNPKPGLQYGGEHVTLVIPDVYVAEDLQGGWKVELNSETLPRVIANERYFTRLSADNKDSEAKAFLNEHMSNASWLVKSLDQRARTILRVATEIVKYQDDFLLKGIRYLRPLNLKTIAEAIEMHESTVSRVTSNKYIHTPRGTFELKYFFTAAIAAREGEGQYSAESVRCRIRELIDAEEPGQPLSDDRLVVLLGQENIEIARRTVAKYREAMQIPSSVQRRRQARAAF